jgi:hypothetical protein
LKERDCSLRLNRESNPVPNETHRACFPRWRVAERKQCSDTKDFVARNCREATRSAKSRRMNTTEINAANLNNTVLARRVGNSAQKRLFRSISSKQLTPG